MDFTLNQYRALLKALKQHGNYHIRHDVDARPSYALRMAQIEAGMGVQATYYFRAIHFKCHAATIKAVAALGHAIGYHYECLTTTRGDEEAAYVDFQNNLALLREIVPVRTACAHGSPRSYWNSQDMWSKYDLHALGIDYEPMLDTDFSRTLYLTDTGRRWDGFKVSVRDKVPQFQSQWEKEGLVFHSTPELICALADPQHPLQRKELLVNVHPQRWMPWGFSYLSELVLQWIKNVFKRILISRSNVF